ncbi:unnamed protein product [Adineta steineri]|uniref:Cytochrome P450 n=1 Tax=Adineta steineri TaxID=433720 RepID=A0A815M0W1_9BILA|nr:unnamed protein product [Adineta steineri]CAF1417070.1 unnamed protein product [Adineta steineri]
MTAGYETTSTTLAYATYVLAKHPEMLQKFSDEIDQLPLDNNNDSNEEANYKYLDYEIAAQMSYMVMFVFEILRMHLIVNAAIERYAFEATIVQGILIEKGTLGHADIYSNHFDREL